MTDVSHAETLGDRQLREKWEFEQLNEVEKADRQLAMRELYARSPWDFLRDCVFTLNQVADGSDSIAPFPTNLDYVHFLVSLWQHKKLLAIPKSRRMICSWTFISLFLHNTIFNSGRFNGFVSKKEDDSGELIARAEFIFNHIPEWRVPSALLPALKNGRMSKQPPCMDFEEIHSKLQGFPQGRDQLRQFTFSGLLFDEWAFWEEASDSYAGAKPTLDGGGRLIGISSRSPGFFKKIVFDQLQAADYSFSETPPVPILRPLEGVEVWENPRNKFTIVDLHYTANPEKRGEAWRLAVAESMTRRDYLMEYEKSWETFEGKPVYEDFRRELHVGRPQVEPGCPLILGWDFGLTPACILAQLVGRQLRVFREFIEPAGSISKLGPVVWNYLMVNFLTWMHNQREMVYNFVDPNGFAKTPTDERSCADIMRVCGNLDRPKDRLGFINVRPGPMLWEPRRKVVESFLTHVYSEGPALLIDEQACPILVAGFSGGYRYPEKAVDIEPASIRPLKDKHSHPHDGFQYLAYGATQLQRQVVADIPVPEYSFQKHERNSTTSETQQVPMTAGTQDRLRKLGLSRR